MSSSPSTHAPDGTSAGTDVSSQKSQVPPREPRSVLVSGASGFVGSALCSYLSEQGWKVRRLVRHEPSCPAEVWWDPGREELAEGAVSGVDALVHLAGENVSGRWTSKKKDRILQSRIKGTRVLARAIVDAPLPPKTFVSASAIGYYGDRGDELLDEGSSAGNDFLAEVCKAWETQATAAASACRVVIPRLGIVLGPDGGALQQMVRPFRLGLGGMLGSGKQYMSWISRLDLVRLLAFALNNDTITGVVNAVSPCPVTNETFTNALSEQVNRPALVRVPAWAMKVGLGEFSGEVLSSKRVNARVASDAGFEWQHPTLELALQWALSEALA